MTGRQLLDAIGEIDDRFILNAEKRPSKRIILSLCAGAACICLILTGIVFFFQKPNPTSPIDCIGGDYHPGYDYAYCPKLYSLDSRLQTWIEDQGHNVGKWLDELDQKNKALPYFGSDPENPPLLLEVIEKYNVPRTQLENFDFTEEELDAIYSGDQAAITRIFATPYAIVIGNRAFAPRFYLNAATEELNACGITQEMIEKKSGLLRKEKIIGRISPIDSYYETDYALPYLPKLYDISAVEGLADGIYDWAEQKILKNVQNGDDLSTSDDLPTVLLAIRTYGIEKNEFEQLNQQRIQYYQQRNEPYFIKNACFSQQEINVLYSEDLNAIIQAFASPYAIIQNGKAYAPQYYLNSQNSEFPRELIEEKRQLLYRHAVLG